MVAARMRRYLLVVRAPTREAAQRLLADHVPGSVLAVEPSKVLNCYHFDVLTSAGALVGIWKWYNMLQPRTLVAFTEMYGAEEAYNARREEDPEVESG